MTRFYELFQWEFSRRNSKMVCDEICEGCFAFLHEIENGLEVMAEFWYFKSSKRVQHRDIMG